jgi:sugar/nucleoside kinase (ribokinase family)
VHAAPDVIGFGALNVDFIASASLMSQTRAERVAEWAARFDWNVETPVDEAEINRAIAWIGHAALETSPGGSAWNTIFALAQMRVGLRLGYVGVLGREETPGVSFLRLMETHGVDHRFVRKEPRVRCGMCLSYIDDGGRVMLTYPGANLGMSRFVRDHFEGLAAYLASARQVHVTSFLDPETPVEVERVLRAARRVNPRLRVSLDLGYDWAAHPSPAVRSLLELADYLFLTRRELKELGGYAHGEPDVVLAGRVLSGSRSSATVILTNRYDTVDAFRTGVTGVARQRVAIATAAASDDDIEDTTGTGDVLAAGLLAALASRRLQVELGAYLGLSLARQRVPEPVAEAFRYPDLSDGFLQVTEEPQRWAVARRGVFVAHGSDPQWRQVKEFLERECGLPVRTLSTEAQGADLAEELRGHLAECGFAVCVLTAEAAGPGELGYADQSVVHQAGLLQGRYGFRRVAILVEHGCQAFSNVAGLIRLDFPNGHIESTFWQLERMLRREGLVR